MVKLFDRNKRLRNKNLNRFLYAHNLKRDFMDNKTEIEQKQELCQTENETYILEKSVGCHLVN